MNKNTATLSAVIVATMLLSAMVLAAPTLSISNMQLPQIFNTAFANPGTNEVVLEAKVLLNGQYAYEMVSHADGGIPVGIGYSNMATIPGPTIIINEGDELIISVTNSIGGGVDPSVIVEGGFNSASAQRGTYVYRAVDDALLGLFGAVIVRASDGSTEPYVQEGTGVITPATTGTLDKEFVLFMVGSTFWGQEIDAGAQTPLWTNPTLHSDEDAIVQFHILSIGHGHTFHLHAHRWVEPGTSAIIDTKLMAEPSDTHVFTVRAGADVGPGHWQYHCHVFAHMEAGMHGIFHVGSTPDATHNPTESEEGASPYGGHPVLADGLIAGLVTFEISDEPGSWFRNTLDISGITKTKSLAVAKPGDSVNFIMSDTNTVHTITSLLWPTGAANMPMDEIQSYKGGGIVQLDDPGLYVFTCKVHPYMFGAVIIDDLTTGPSEEAGSAIGESLDLDGEEGTLTLVTGLTFPTASDLGLRLLKTFFVATTPSNYKDYTQATWNPEYPAVNIRASGIEIGTNAFSTRPGGGGLNGLLDFYFGETESEDIASPGEHIIPEVDGVGEVWVDTQFEKTSGKTKPGTSTRVDVENWEVTRKVSLGMNNPHNMWTDRDQAVIYQTEWFDNKLTIFDRETGAFQDQIIVGEAPSHVMTRANNDDIHVALNGEEGVAEILAGTNQVDRIIAMQGLGQNPTHPHAHWMSSDGQKMVTPNTFTADSSLYGFALDEILAKPSVGALPIATGMMPDDSKYYVANLLDSTISVIDMDGSQTGTVGGTITTINLLEDYNPLSLDLSEPGGWVSAIDFTSGPLIVGALPIQTPVSPDGKAMVTANTLSGTITVTDTTTDTVVTTLFCDPGCHGVQFGAKAGGGYYAYVSNKFSNVMHVVDIDKDGDGTPFEENDIGVVGRILLVEEPSTAKDYSTVTNMPGMGGQGVMPIPNVYNGWVQCIPTSVISEWELTTDQKNPGSPATCE